MGAEERFEYFLIFGKVLLILTLLVLSFVNGHVGYVKDKPRDFMIDNTVSGATGAIAFMIIAQMRGRGDLMVSVGISAFLLLFMLNVLFEFSGFNSASSNTSSMTATEKKEVKVLKWPVIVGGLVGLMGLIGLARSANVPLIGSNLMLEAGIFGVLSGVSAAVVAAHHGSSAVETTVGTIGMTVFFAGLHVALQKGGFYNNLVFPDAPPCIR